MTVPKKKKRGGNKERGQRGACLRLKEFPERALDTERWIKCRVASSLGFFVAFPAARRRRHCFESAGYRDKAAPSRRANCTLRRPGQRKTMFSHKIYFPQIQQQPRKIMTVATYGEK